MELETKEQKAKLRFSEIFRCLCYAVMVVFLLSSMIFQAFLYMDHLEMKQRLAAIDKKVHAIELPIKKSFPTNQPQTTKDLNRLDVEDLHVRLKRAVPVSLQSLEKRLKALEIRYDQQAISLF